MSTYDVPRVTAIQTLSNGTELRLPGLALWVAQLPAREGESVRIVGGFRYTDALASTEPVSLVKVYA